VDQPLRPDTRSWPLPWIDGAVMVAGGEGTEAEVSEGGGSVAWQDAPPGSKGEVVIWRHYPYLALTVWASEGFGTPTWVGDLDRWRKYFAPGARGGYVQGDAAIR
jgi:hypothetical protein